MGRGRRFCPRNAALECGLQRPVSLLDQFPATPSQRLLGDVELVADLPVRDVRLEQRMRQPAALVDVEPPVGVDAAKVEQQKSEISDVELAAGNRVDLRGAGPLGDLGEVADGAHERHPRTLSDA